MEILQEKHNHIEKYGVWTCRNCGSTIKSKIDEGQRVCDQRDGDYIKVNCPVCDYENNIDVNKYKSQEEKPSGNYYNR